MELTNKLWKIAGVNHTWLLNVIYTVGESIAPREAFFNTLNLCVGVDKKRGRYKGVGVYLNHLRYTDDLDFISSHVEEVDTMLQELNQTIREVSLEMHEG